MEDGKQEVDERRTKKQGKSRGGKSKKTTKSAAPGIVNVNVNVPTFQQRAAQLRAVEGAPVEAPHVAQIPLSQLSAAMDALFPVSQEPALVPQQVLIDSSGFMDLASAVYTTIVTYDDKLERVLSEPEFLLVSAQIKDAYILDMRTRALSIVIQGQEDLLRAILPNAKMPAPLVHYLEGLGVIRSATGEIIVPNIVLPRRDPPQAHQIGMLPSVSGDSYTTNTHWELNSCMPQYGMLARAIINGHATNAYGHGHALHRLDPAVANPVDDAHYARPACLPKSTFMRPMHRERMGRLTQPFSFQQGLADAIRYNPQLLQHYQLFCERASKLCPMHNLPASTAGTPAYLAWAVPENGDDVTFPTSFYYYSSCKLSDAEQHAARLFRYRQRRTRDDSCSEPLQTDRDACFTASTPSSQWATMLITAMPAYTVYLGHYVRHFIHM